MRARLLQMACKAHGVEPVAARRLERLSQLCVVLRVGQWLLADAAAVILSFHGTL